MVTLMAAPGEQQVDLWKAASPQSQAACEAVAQAPELDIASSQCHFALMSHKGKTDRPPQGVLKVFMQQQKVGRSETVILKAAQRRTAVDVWSAERLLKIEWHCAAAGGNRL